MTRRRLRGYARRLISAALIFVATGGCLWLAGKPVVDDQLVLLGLSNLVLVIGSGGGEGGGGGDSSLPTYTPTHYVTAAASGGGDGSIGDPWTLSEAMSQAVAGDIVQVGPGQYTGSAPSSRWNAAFRPSNSGTSENPIIFFAENRAGLTYSAGVTSELRSGGTSAGNGGPAFGISGQDYVIFDGFFTDENSANNHPSADTGPVVMNGSVGSEIRSCVVLGDVAAWSDNHCGIRFEQVLDCVASDCYISGFAYEPGPSASQNSAGIMGYDCTGCTIEHCEITACGIGIFWKGWHHHVSDVLSSPTPTTTQFALDINGLDNVDDSGDGDDLSRSDDAYNGNPAFFTTGSRAFEYRTATDYVASSGLLTLNSALSGAPATDDQMFVAVSPYTMSGLVCRYNDISECLVANVRIAAPPGITQTQVYQNLLTSTLTDIPLIQLFSYDAASPRNVALVNNTLVGDGSPIGLFGGGAGDAIIRWVNNIVSGVNVVHSQYPNDDLSVYLAVLVEHDYNCYHSYSDFSADQGGGTVNSATFASYGESNSLNATDPEFVGGGDYSLSPGSPCEDAGLDVLNLLGGGTSASINMGCHIGDGRTIGRRT